MIKVMIADDEERICQLIEALIDWESLHMEVAGIAHNGLEACEMVKQIKPDILITDIRMPGCNGLDLIENVKKSVEDLQVVIISGYAQFAYAQTAIKFGVGDYLLKPINKVELASTLQKFKERIEERLQLKEEQLYSIRVRQISAFFVQISWTGCWSRGCGYLPWKYCRKNTIFMCRQGFSRALW